ncbi:hypothetical protein LCGC14_0548790 [marine sediment metagenome]|uniref:Uncharacterized protein n=1 Tax=marine sediment metagenome TaxID=412755 RepID=A0A0F9RVG7_9ZZZZ
MNPKDWKVKEFQTYFGTQDKFRDNLITLATGKYSIDIIKFDEWLKEEHGYNETVDGSMEDFIKVSFGQEAVEFIVSLL